MALSLPRLVMFASTISKRPITDLPEWKLVNVTGMATTQLVSLMVCSLERPTILNKSWRSQSLMALLDQELTTFVWMIAASSTSTGEKLLQSVPVLIAGITKRPILVLEPPE
jgi:hypothetical protein